MHPKFGGNSPPQILQVSLRRCSNFESSSDVQNFLVRLMRRNFSYMIGFTVASSSACYLTNGDYCHRLPPAMEMSIPSLRIFTTLFKEQFPSNKAD